MTERSDRISDTFLIDSLGEPLFVVDPNDTLIYANERLGEITTQPPAEFENSPITELTAFVEAGFDDLQEGIDAILQEDTTERRVDVSMTHPDGAPVDSRTSAEARLTELTDEDGLVGVLVVMRDITDRKETEQHLHTSERRFRAMFEAHSAPMLLVEPQSGNIEEANAAAADFYGHSIGELTEMAIQQINRLSPSEVAAERRRARAQNRNHFEFEHELASGEVRTVEVHSSPIEVDGRELLFSIIHDITERKRREREYEQIFNSVNDGIIGFDPDAEEITEVNDASKEMFGYDFEQIRERGIAGLSATNAGFTEDQAEEVVARVAESGESEEHRWQAETADCERCVVESTVTAATVDGERRVLTINRDVTDRRRRQHQLELIVERIDEAIYLVDTDEGRGPTFLSPAYEDLTGLSTEQLYEDPQMFTENIHPDDQENYREYLDRMDREINAGNTQDRYDTEFRFERPDGAVRWFRGRGYPIEDSSKYAFIGVLDDITERKRREQRLAVFNRILRHNLRNQLDVIRSYAEELADQTENNHADRIIDATDELAEIGRSAQEIDRIISKDEKPTEIDIAESLRETVEAMDPGRSDVTLTTEFPNKVRLRTDEESVTMAVESALQNALESAASTVTVAIKESADKCIITIGDDGPGIPEEALTPIQVGRETPLQHGRGLGLWQLRWCVDTLNGDLSFESGDGTTVRITVPDQNGSAQPD